MSHHAHGICGGFRGMSAPVFSGGAVVGMRPSVREKHAWRARKRGLPGAEKERMKRAKKCLGPNAGRRHEERSCRGGVGGTECRDVGGNGPFTEKRLVRHRGENLFPGEMPGRGRARCVVRLRRLRAKSGEPGGGLQGKREKRALSSSPGICRERCREAGRDIGRAAGGGVGQGRRPLSASGTGEGRTGERLALRRQ